MHVDMDAFFASVALRHRPDLWDVPVIVGGAHRSVVLAANYPARKLGISSGMPALRARRMVPGLVTVPPVVGCPVTMLPVVGCPVTMLPVVGCPVTVLPVVGCPVTVPPQAATAAALSAFHGRSEAQSPFQTSITSNNARRSIGFDRLASMPASRHLSRSRFIAWAVIAAIHT